jgi:hypothetical protein
MSQGDNWLEGGNPQKQGMSGGSKVLIGFLVFGGICALACCGVGGFVYYKFTQAFNMTVAPAEVETRAQEIVQFKAPGRFKPVMAMKMDFASVKMNMATYQIAPNGGTISIIESSMPFEQAKDQAEEIQKQMKQAQQGQGGAAAPPAAPAAVEVDKEEPPASGEMAPAEGEDPKTPTETPDEGQDKTEIKERTIRGQKVEVKYSHSTDETTGKKSRSMTVVIPGKTPDTSVVITLETPEAAWNEAEVETFVESIQ